MFERRVSFRPERVLFRPGSVNLCACLCGVPMYASAQPLDFLARTKNASFPNRKPLVSNPGFPDGHELRIYQPPNIKCLNVPQAGSINME